MKTEKIAVDVTNKQTKLGVFMSFVSCVVDKDPDRWAKTCATGELADDYFNSVRIYATIQILSGKLL